MGDIFRHDVKIGDKITTNFDKNSKSYSTLEDFARSLFLNGHRTQATGLPVASGGSGFEFSEVTGNIWKGYKIKFGKFCLIFGKMNSNSTGVKKIMFGETFSQIPIVLRTFQNGSAAYHDGIACGDLITYNVTTTYFEYNQRYSNRGLASFLIAGVLS